MAVTTNRGVVATDDPLSNDLAVSMDTQVANQDVNTTQFSSMLMKLPVTTSKSFKEEWMEDVYLPKNTALSATAASADTNLAVTTSEGNYGKVGDIGKFVQTGEAFRITATGASAWTVVRAIGTVAAATAASGTTQGGLVIVNGSNEQDGGLPTALVTSKTANYNYHQIIRNAYTFTNTAQWTNWYSGNPLTYHRKKIAVEHKRELENGLFFGARSYTAGTSTPRATFGGLDEFISTNITDAGGTFDKGELQDFLRGGMEYRRPDEEGAVRRTDRRPGPVGVPAGQLGARNDGRQHLRHQGRLRDLRRDGLPHPGVREERLEAVRRRVGPAHRVARLPRRPVERRAAQGTVDSVGIAVRDPVLEPAVA
jgi:hypothetical protein